MNLICDGEFGRRKQRRLSDEFHPKQNIDFSHIRFPYAFETDSEKYE